jgi:hypothetical protein
MVAFSDYFPKQYSCSNLKDDDPARYIRASEARRQVLEAPDKRPRLPAETSKRGKLASYPETFKNREKLPLQAQSPWKEYPVMPSGSWDPATGKHGVKATRAIYNNGDRGTFDVIYHDPTISDRHDETSPLLLIDQLGNDKMLLGEIRLRCWLQGW